ncbi:hyaluronan-binding protein 2-like [Xyrichtys novacula]|uniref:trypsin n=1 Tax=Xyrichtys novacula TaxID=13765 RepID=A0AAV1G3D0_XYRNO|nr:hyaluronan-binding protein 2-like [Xyrichtys novacula]
MNLKILFFCLLLAALLIPADMRRKKERKKFRHRHDNHDHEHHDHDHHGPGHHKHGKRKNTFKDIIEDFFFAITDGGDDDDDEDQSNSDWLYELQEPEGQCDPNPCLNNGECEPKGRRRFKCDCPKPFKGRRCQRAPKICRRGKCGRGECVLTSTHPFYECKCKAPFQPPDCRTYSLCDPNPCKNGGTCVIDENDFTCQCPPGYSGLFCHVGPGDCFIDDGESYRGNVSETDDGDECLQWNSHFILARGVDPFDTFEDKDGLGPHNFCRNPDGERMPWCFFRRGRHLLWDYCDIAECPEPTGEAPTEEPSPSHDPPSPEPEPTKPEPTKPEPTKPEPTKPEPTKPEPTKPEPTKPEPTKPEPTQAVEPTRPEPMTTQAPPPPEPTVSLAPAAPSPPPQQFSTCGKPQPKKPITKIFGGLKVPPGAIPWQVSLQVRPQNTNHQFRHICGGVLIESCWVLTAGHCIEQRKDMQVVMGSLSLDTVEPDEQIINVEQAIVHENYRETPSAVYNDIALLRLSGANGVCANETQFVKTACLPDAPLPDGMECTISGWGATEISELGSNHLLEANVLLINQEKCSEPRVYGKSLDNSMFCAGHLQGGVDSCQGDSGGPLTCEQNGSHVVYGLVSWGDQCGRKNKPGVYTRVSSFTDWIRSKTQATPA